MWSLNVFGLSVQASDTMQIKQDITRVEEERIQVLNSIEELEHKIKDLDTQVDESIREVCVRSFNYSKHSKLQDYQMSKNDYEHILYNDIWA